MIRQGVSRGTEIQPVTARLQTTLVPDNPLVLDGLTALYLNSEKALELSANQVEAVLGWLHGGGHLIIAVEELGDVNSVPWLKALVPLDLNDVRTVAGHGDLQQWVRGTASTATANPFASLPDDSTFEGAELRVAAGKLLRGQVLASADGVPLMVTQRRAGAGDDAAVQPGARAGAVVEEPANLLGADDGRAHGDLRERELQRRGGGWSVDGIFGAMIDSKQVRKLPVEWLLLLLMVYLVVIGPLDRSWLKRIAGRC